VDGAERYRDEHVVHRLAKQIAADLLNGGGLGLVYGSRFQNDWLLTADFAIVYHDLFSWGRSSIG
jgi:hypothetical protein